MEYWNQACHFLISLNFVVGYCVFVSLVASYGALVLSRGIKQPRVWVQQATAKLQTYSGEEEFAHKFNEFNEWVLSSGLGGLWSEFKETLVLPGPMGEPIVYNTDQSGCCFNLDSIVSHRLNLKFFGAVPNYLTGFGILGTFIGLVGGITIAGKGLASGNSVELQASLQGLLSGASLAFWTSIFGLLTSILFSAFEKKIVHGLEGDILKWNEELDGRIRRLTIESLGYEQSLQTKRQTEYLESFATEVAINLSNAIDQGVNQKLVPVLDRLASEVQGMRQDRSDTNDSMLRDVVERFTQSMTGAAGQEIASLSNTLGEMNKSLAPLVGQMGEAQREMQGAAAFIAEQVRESYATGSQAFSQGIQNAIEALGNSVHEAGQTLNGDMKSAFDDAAQRLRETVGAMDNSVESVRAAGAVSADVVDKAKTLLDEFHKVTDTVQTLGQRFDGGVQGVQRATDNLAETARSIQDAGTKAVAGMDALHQGLARYEEMQKRLQEIWHDYSNRFTDVDKTLENVFRQLDGGMNAFAESTSVYLGQLDEHSGKALDTLAAAIKELQDTVEELTEALENTRRDMRA